jgi:prefoldin subunit 5
MDLLPKEEFKVVTVKINDRIKELVEFQTSIRQALNNHTNHITQVKKDLETKTPQR